MTAPETVRRRTLALAIAALTACASYAVQRLLDAWGEPPPGAVLLQATIPYYWRVAGAALHGATAGLLVAWGAPDRAVARWLERIPWLTALAIAPAAAAMLLVP